MYVNFLMRRMYNIGTNVFFWLELLEIRCTAVEAVVTIVTRLRYIVIFIRSYVKKKKEKQNDKFRFRSPERTISQTWSRIKRATSNLKFQEMRVRVIWKMVNYKT